MTLVIKIKVLDWITDYGYTGESNPLGEELTINWSDDIIPHIAETCYTGGAWPRFKVTKVMVDGEEKAIR